MKKLLHLTALLALLASAACTQSPGSSFDFTGSHGITDRALYEY